MRYTKRHIEDWDFRDCYPDASNYDAQADLFLSTHYTTVVAVESIRFSFITLLLDNGLAVIEPDHQHVRLVDDADGVVAGFASGESRFTRSGRWTRRVIRALRRESEKYGHLRITLRPEQGSVAAAYERLAAERAASRGPGSEPNA